MTNIWWDHIFLHEWIDFILSTDRHPINPCEAKNKSWFGCVEAYRMLDSCWTVLSETSLFAQTELENLDAAGEWWDDGGNGEEEGDGDTQR